MCCEFRGIWLFHQSSSEKGGGVSLLVSRRFKTVELRVSRAFSKAEVPLAELPADEMVSDRFAACILKERCGPPVEIDTVSESLKSELDGTVFSYDVEAEDGKKERDWPLGPTCELEGVWPFIFVSSDGNYDEEPQKGAGRFFVCGVVATTPSKQRVSLLDLPEVSAGFGALETLIDFLPSRTASGVSPGSVAKFMYNLKTAMPFGAPFLMSINTVNQLGSSSVTSDSAILSQATGRIPSWKPFPSAASSGMMKLNVLECVCFELSEKGVGYTAVTGKVTCDADLPGTPEVILPITSAVKLNIQLHDCSTVTETATTEKNAVKISLVPLASAFTVLDYACTLSKQSLFPIESSFRLFQISPQQFRFTLWVKLKVLFSQFSVVFRIHPHVQIGSTPHLSHSAKTKVEIAGCAFLWTFRTPATFNPQGELVEGVIETERALSAGEELTRNACMHFRKPECHFTKISIARENVSVFPNSARTSTSVSYAMVSGKNCFVLNSALHDATAPCMNFEESVDISSLDL